VLNHQAAFMDALRSSREIRKCMFDTIEQRHARDFGNSRVGPGLYENLLLAVRESGATEAVKEFESRFFPLLNSDPSRDADIGASEARPNQKQVIGLAGRWGLMSALFVVALVGALIAVSNAVKITAAETTRTAAKTIASETTLPPAQAEEAEAPVAATQAAEPASEMTTGAAPVSSAQQEVSGRE
jgi:hypothetical protein